VTAAAIIFGTIVLLFFSGSSFLLAAMTLSKVVRIEARIAGLQRALVEIGGRTAPAPEGASTGLNDPSSPGVRLN
jgi:hypothetical protein